MSDKSFGETNQDREITRLKAWIESDKALIRDWQEYSHKTTDKIVGLEAQLKEAQGKALLKSPELINVMQQYLTVWGAPKNDDVIQRMIDLYGEIVGELKEAQDRIAELEAEIGRVAPYLAVHGVFGYKFEPKANK